MFIYSRFIEALILKVPDVKALYIWKTHWKAQFLQALSFRFIKAPEHEYIFSKYSWNLIKNIILMIFWRVAWNYLNNCLQKKLLNSNRFSLISLKNFEFHIIHIKLVWFETWNFKFRLMSENKDFYILEIL